MDLLSVRGPRVDDAVVVPSVLLNVLVSDCDMLIESIFELECVADRRDAVDDGSVETVRVDVSVAVADAEFESDTSALGE